MGRDADPSRRVHGETDVARLGLSFGRPLCRPIRRRTSAPSGHTASRIAR